jgi:signal transduction histidine kinase
MGPDGAKAFKPTVTDVAIVVLLYTLAAYRPRRASLTGLAVGLLGSAVAIARYAPLHTANAGAVLLLTIAAVGVTLVAAWVLGDSMAYRRAYYVSLEDRLAVAERARDLASKRARAVDESAATLRRIERDLHDGAQVRLAALAMALGEIKENLTQAGGDASTLRLLGSAHQNAKDALTELRDLARGIHPPVLDRGLRPALALLAETSAIPVTLSVEVGDRPSPAIEAIAYFCVAELLANAAKHSAARTIAVGVREVGDGLVLTVTDDGAGGAVVAPGGGLAGLLERVQTVDGRLDVASPAGGPTTITIELPRHA